MSEFPPTIVRFLGGPQDGAVEVSGPGDAMGAPDAAVATAVLACLVFEASGIGATIVGNERGIGRGQKHTYRIDAADTSGPIRILTCDYVAPQ